MSTRAPGQEARWTRMRLLSGAAYVAVGVVLAAVAAWPIYRSSEFLLLVVVGSLLGAGVAVLVQWRGWDGWAAAGLLAAAMLLSGVPLAVPARTGDAGEVLRGVGELLSGAVLGWKDLLTVELPVGSYRNLLVPALIVFVVGTCSALLLSWRSDAVAVGAVPIVIAMSAFGLLFGAPAVSAPLPIGPFAVPAPRETAVGVALLISGVLWLSWRSHDLRRRALSRAADASGVRLHRRGSQVDARRVLLGAGMLAVAAIGVVAVVPAAAQSADREVLRAATGPDIDLSRTVSPLTSYRSLFADARVDTVLFAVTGDALPDRVRLATLDAYDGAVYRTGTSDPGSRFVRVPSARAAGSGIPLSFTVVNASLSDVWMPTAGTVSAVDYSGSRAAALADGFYYSDTLDAAVQTAGWRPGDMYRVTARERETPALAAAVPPGGVDTSVEVPASLRTWMDDHVAGSGGQALAGLVGLLRERGYLSHALLSTDAQVWSEENPDHVFVSSAAGHSLARIGELFDDLLERESAPAGADLVAAVGDDEQFAVAVSLMAQRLGFPARVVVGARLSTDDPDLAACDDGRCSAGDLSAWVEVRDATGVWIPVDVTPQSAVAPDLDVVERQDPRIGTQVRPDAVEEVVPRARPRTTRSATTRRPPARTGNGCGRRCGSPGSRGPVSSCC